jgi:predicted esterase
MFRLPSRPLLVLAIACAAGAPVRAQNFAPPLSRTPDDATLRAIEEKTHQLGDRVDAPRRGGVRDPQLAEVQIYHKAATWIRQHNEFYQPEAGRWTLEVLERGLRRAEEVGRGEFPWLNRVGRTAIRAYRSLIDGSVQPYAVTLPPGYDKERTRRWRVDVLLHGRDPGLTEAKFLHEHDDKPAPEGEAFVRIDIYGRGNVGYRWAGEMDVVEAVENFAAVERLLGRDGQLDPSRVVLRGFSMGGAGTWQLGLHTPGRWALLGPGAGFTTTHGYARELPPKLPPYQEACLHIYDAADYAENVFDVPVVAYAGQKDPQRQAAETVQARLKALDLSMEFLTAPGVAHHFPPEWRKKAEEAYARKLLPGRPEYPPRVRFVTYTLRYAACAWVEILALDRHYDRALVDAERTETGFTVRTANVQALRLGLPPNPPEPIVLSIDGQTVTARPWLSRSGSQDVYLERREGQWSVVLPQKIYVAGVRRPQKMPRLQGPIDDAFMGAFVCVRGTGSAWHEAVQAYAERALQSFQAEWSRHFRGTLPVKDDREVTEEDIAERHLILFGDPGSNALIRQVIESVPLSWTKEQIRLGDQSYAADRHVPALIYPSPLNATRYIVLNTGHTFPAADFERTNALLFPRLGDYAVLRLRGSSPSPAEPVIAGLFDDHWRLPRSGQRAGSVDDGR